MKDTYANVQVQANPPFGVKWLVSLPKDQENEKEAIFKGNKLVLKY
jgi:hypothetical protein